MPVGDTSVFSVADAAFWAAIQDSGATATTLLNWRKEQSQGGEASGRDFDDGEIPKLSELSSKDCPALIVVDRGATVADDVGPDFRGYSYPKAVLGVLWAQRRETEVSKKVKRYAELVYAVLIEAAATSFNAFVSAPNPIRRVEIGQIEFPQFETDTVAAFGMTVTFVLDLPVS